VQAGAQPAAPPASQLPDESDEEFVFHAADGHLLVATSEKVTAHPIAYPAVQLVVQPAVQERLQTIRQPALQSEGHRTDLNTESDVHGHANEDLAIKLSALLTIPSAPYARRDRELASDLDIEDGEAPTAAVPFDWELSVLHSNFVAYTVSGPWLRDASLVAGAARKARVVREAAEEELAAEHMADNGIFESDVLSSWALATCDGEIGDKEARPAFSVRDSVLNRFATAVRGLSSGEATPPVNDGLIQL
jgi:hypothetical protein